ncbi:MAG: hypothetical protein Q9223_003722, partial [Gallowayella weberi]
PPIIPTAIVLVLRSRLLRQPRGPRAAHVRRDAREQVHFHQSAPLARGDFVFHAQGGEQGEVEELVRWDADAWFFAEEGGGEGGGEVDLGEGAVGEEVGVVAVIAEVVEGFVWVFDGEFDDGGGVEEVIVDCFVEVRAVGVGLVGREDEELGYAGAGRDVGEGEGSGGVVGVCGGYGVGSRSGFSRSGCFGREAEGEWCLLLQQGGLDRGVVGGKAVGGAVAD